MNYVKRVLYSIIQYRRRKKLDKCGKNVYIGKGVLSGHIEIGSNVSVGAGAWFVSSRAKLIIHDNVVFAPNVTIYTGDHMTNSIGRHISELTDKDKDDSKMCWDEDVLIESGCWIGTRAIILKGVTIGKGSVIGAGAVVTQNVPAYSVYVGMHSSKTYNRFTKEQIIEHEGILEARGLLPDSFSQ